MPRDDRKTSVSRSTEPFAVAASEGELVHKAGSVRKRELVGPWVHGVAQRVTLEARGGASRRQVPVRLDPEAPAVDDHDGLERDERHATLYEELGRLPE
jgi:RNA polymerase sigma-70 factor (ECF subfamily)